MSAGPCSAHHLYFPPARPHPQFQWVIHINECNHNNNTQVCSEAHSQPTLHFVKMTTKTKQQEVQSTIVAEWMECAEETPPAVVDQKGEVIARTRGRSEGPQQVTYFCQLGSTS